MKSMTGYGEASHQNKNAKITVQVRSLNHRHLDLQLRVPREYLGFEEEIRKSLRETVSRGRIELFINRTSAPGHAREVGLDEELLGKYLKAIQRAKKKFHLKGEFGISIFSSVPDLVRVRDTEINPRMEKQALFTAVRLALQKLEESRIREGRHLRMDMQSQLRHLKSTASDLEKYGSQFAPSLMKGSAAARSDEALTKAGNEAVDVTSAVFKGDINEEVVRLKTHTAALGTILRESGAVGKKLEDSERYQA